MLSRDTPMSLNLTVLSPVFLSLLRVTYHTVYSVIHIIVAVMHM